MLLSRACSFSYSSPRPPSQSFPLPSLTASLPLQPEQISSPHRLNGLPTIRPLDTAPTPDCPNDTASSHLPTEQPALLPLHAPLSSHHFPGHDPSAGYRTATSHSVSSIEDWVDETLRERPTCTLAETLKGIPTPTPTSKQPPSPTSPPFLEQHRNGYCADQDFDGVRPLLLTKRRLRLHTEIMADLGVYKTPTKENAQRKAPGPSPSSSGSSKMNTDPRWVKTRMQDHHIYRGSDAFGRADCSEFNQNVRSAISSERPSGVKPAEASRFKKIHDTCVNNGVTEATLKREMLKNIIKDDLQVLTEPGHPAQDIHLVYESRDTFEGGIFCQADQPLRRGYLPHNYPLGLKDVADRLKVDGMTNSVPDSTWGYLDKVLDPIPAGAMLQDRTKALLTICPALYCPFFFLEVKPDGGSMDACRNQAARGCATIVNAMRLLLRTLGREDTVGPDEDSYIYCATMNEELVEWWVGWAEVCEDGQVNWHMNRIHREDIEQERALLVTRRYMHNILEWGLTTRLPIIRKLVSDLYIKDTRVLAEEVKKGLPKTPSTGTKRKEIHLTPPGSTVAGGSGDG